MWIQKAPSISGFVYLQLRGFCHLYFLFIFEKCGTYCAKANIDEIATQMTWELGQMTSV